MSRPAWRRPRIATTLVYGGLIAVFLAAASWQWRRAEYKENRAAEFHAALSEPARRPLLAALASPAAQGFERVRVHGELDRAHLVLLDNQISNGRFGVQVYAVLSDASGVEVLTDLGWIASDSSRRLPPAIPDLPARIDDEVLLTDPPASGLRLGAAAPVMASAFPLLLTRIDPVELAPLLQRPALSLRVLQLAASPHSGFERVWRLQGLSADKHRGYALQWLSFALGTFVFFILWHRPRGDSPNV